MCGCNTPKKPVSSTPSSTLSSSGNFTSQSVISVVDENDKQQMVMVEYVGPVMETFTLRSRISKDISYRFGNNELHRYRSVFFGDAEWMVGLNGRDGKPMYKIVAKVGTVENQDPASFIGQPIMAV